MWLPLLVVAVAFLVASYFATNLYANFLSHIVWLIVLLIAVVALIGIKYFTITGQYVKAFYASCLTILGVVFTGIIGLYPNLIPSSIDAQYSLTAFNSSSSAYTLTIMTVVAAIFVPIVIVYQIWVYAIFKKRLRVQEVVKDRDAY